MVAICVLTGGIVVPNFLGWRENQNEAELSMLGGHQKYYKLLATEWNTQVAEGKYGSRIDNERIIVRVWREKFKYEDDIDWNKWYYDTKYSKVTHINTGNRSVRTSWIKRNLIRPIHSVWGLTQDFEQLQKRFEQLQKEIDKSSE